LQTDSDSAALLPYRLPSPEHGSQGEDRLTSTLTRPWRLDWMIPLIGVFVMASAAVAAEAPDATLYDVTQAMKVAGTKVPHRIAEGALAGTAKLGSPLCPKKLGPKLPAGASECWLTATGVDDINLETGQGTLAAIIIPVTTGDNPFGAPQLAIERMTVTGRIDFSAALGGAPFGTVQGRVDSRHKFTGVFLQPFLGSVVEASSGQTLRHLFCPLSMTPNPSLGGPDYAWVEVDAAGSMTGRCIDIQPNQLSLGYPTLRFDLFFQ